MDVREGQTGKAQERAEAQRNRILCAARACFIEHGFHAASMAEISAAAQMSPGLIYRYFENKNAIILAIIARQLEEARADIAALQSGTDLLPRIVDLFTRWKGCDPRVMNPVLFLEMCAHSSRDPQIARALDEAERIRGEDFRAWIRRSAGDAGLDPGEDEIRRCAFVLQCFIEGLAVRAVREPQLEPAVLAESLRLFLPQLLQFRGD